MKQSIAKKASTLVRLFRRKSRADKIRLISIGTAVVLQLLFIAFIPQFGAFFSQFRTSDFAVGLPAPRDVEVDKDITYIDEAATQVRKDAVASLISPVFMCSSPWSTT